MMKNDQYEMDSHEFQTSFDQKINDSTSFYKFLSTGFNLRVLALKNFKDVPPDNFNDWSSIEVLA